MKTLYVAGETFLHRLSPRVKLAALAIMSLVLFLIHSPVLLAFALAASGLLQAYLRLSWRQSWLRLRAIALTILAVSLFTAFFNGPAEAFVVMLRLSALALLAASITASTSTGDFIDVVTDAFRPLEKIGLVRAADIGLAIGLIIRFVPDVASRYKAIRDAHQARGLKPGMLSLSIPLIIQTLKNADEVAAAIDARALRVPDKRPATSPRRP